MPKYVRRHLLDPGDKLVCADEIADERELRANFFCPYPDCPCVYRFRPATEKRAAHFYQYGPVHLKTCPLARKEDGPEED